MNTQKQSTSENPIQAPSDAPIIQEKRLMKELAELNERLQASGKEPYELSKPRIDLMGFMTKDQLMLIGMYHLTHGPGNKNPSETLTGSQMLKEMARRKPENPALPPTKKV